jgi:hypothetical protein
MVSGKLPFTFVLDDPAGNAHIGAIDPLQPLDIKSDTQITIEYAPCPYSCSSFCSLHTHTHTHTRLNQLVPIGNMIVHLNRMKT